MINSNKEMIDSTWEQGFSLLHVAPGLVFNLSMQTIKLQMYTTTHSSCRQYEMCWDIKSPLLCLYDNSHIECKWIEIFGLYLFILILSSTFSAFQKQEIVTSVGV